MNCKLRTFFYNLCCIAMVVLIGACSNQPLLPAYNLSIPDFNTVDGPLTSERAAAVVEDFDILHVSEQMKVYVDPYVSRSMPQWQRANVLNTLLRGSAFLSIDYRAEDTFTAEQAFIQESANCVGYANLYIALARHYGLNVKYQLVRRYPEWNRQDGGSGQMMSLAIHINSLLRLPQGQQMVVDVTPKITEQLGKAEVISDHSATALFYNNLAIEQFSETHYLEAYRLLTKAMEYDINMDLLWVNLGAVYRHNGQLEEAEAAYKNALKINPDSYTAMNNLAVLYQMREDWPQFDVYIKKTQQYRQRNPYYHFQLAQLAEQEHDYSAAIGHVQTAIKLKSNEPEFHTSLNNLNQMFARRTMDINLSKSLLKTQKLGKERTHVQIQSEKSKQSVKSISSRYFGG